jgi:hypothetical protein
VGGRSTVSSSIKQVVEIRDTDDERFARLLEILGQFSEQGKILVFVNSQEKCSNLFQQLFNYGHPNLMIHGDMQQACCCFLFLCSDACSGISELCFLASLDAKLALMLLNEHRAMSTSCVARRAMHLIILSECVQMTVLMVCQNLLVFWFPLSRDSYWFVLLIMSDRTYVHGQCHSHIGRPR